MPDVSRLPIFSRQPNPAFFKEQFWEKYEAPIDRNYYFDLFSFTLQNRNILQTQPDISTRLDGILRNLLKKARKPKHYDHLRRLAGVVQVLKPDAAFPRMVEAIGYLDSDNGASAYATLFSLPLPLQQIQQEIVFHQNTPRIAAHLTFLRQFFEGAKRHIDDNPEALSFLK